MNFKIIFILLFISIHYTSVFSQSTDMDPDWVIVAKDIDEDRYFGETVANGMIGLVSSPEPLKIQDVVLNGVYDKYGRGRVENILKVFNPVNLTLIFDNIQLNSSNISNFSQRLDMRKAVFITEFDHGPVHVIHKLRALRHLPFTSLVEMTVSTKEDVMMQCQNNIESPDHLREVKNLFSQINRPHVKIPLLSSVAFSPTGRHELAASSSFVFDEDMPDEPIVMHEDWDANRHFALFNKELKAGTSYTFSVVASICATAQVSDPHNEAERLSIYAALEGREKLIQYHEAEWNKLWSSDIIIEGDVQSQQDIHNFIYHLYAFVREGSGNSLSPMGLSGLGYNGHVFWDTELWMYPPLLILHPEIARSLIDYRIDRMDAARQNAKSHGFDGVMFPWESAEDGSEQTPVWALTGPFQHHITADIAWATWLYYQVTKDKDWLEKKGFPLLKEVAAFWCSRVERNGPGHYDIKNVIGANEYEENIDNNAFTNAMAKIALTCAHDAALVLGEQPDNDWMTVADNIPILKFADETTRENATYNGSIIKQADVNLLAHPLYFYTDKKQIKKDLDYYTPRYDEQGPAMGYCTLATIYAQNGEIEKGYEYFKTSYEPNKVPPFGVLSETKNGNNPYFITGAGGALQTVLYGFGGIRITEDGIIQTGQNLPKAWKSLTIKANHID